MKITETQLKEIIKEELDLINEQDFDGESGAPITARGKELCAKDPACREKWIDSDGKVKAPKVRKEPPATTATGRELPPGTQSLADQAHRNLAQILDMETKLRRLLPAVAKLVQTANDTAKESLPRKVYELETRVRELEAAAGGSTEQ